MRPLQITEITSYLSKAHNWKSPGNDQIQNYWLKAFPATHRHITKKLPCNIRGTGEGTSLADHRNNLFDTKIRRQQGRSQKLPTHYMLNDRTLTGIIAKRISTQLEEQNLLPAEQEGCQPGSKVCKDQLMVSKAIYEECRRRNKNLSTVWIDYQKAFDSVPHRWVEKSIALVGVNSKIVRFCEISMEKWNTRLFLKNKAGSNAVTTHSDTKRNIPRGLSFAITLLHSTDSINKRAEQT